MSSIWIIDDDDSIRWVLSKAMQNEGMACNCFSTGEQARLALLRGNLPGIIFCDIRMPGESGLSLLSFIQQQHPQLPIIIMTAYTDLDAAVNAYQKGAYEYLPKPFDVNQAVTLARRITTAAKDRSQAVRDELPTGGKMPEIIGQAPAMQKIFRTIGRLSKSVATVLINGESGTGKELVAKALHRYSLRASGPFIPINMAAIPRDLLESELFGHERGAFTGATTDRPGRFEQAENGTLFLDEIGDMSLELQTRLLRVLSDGVYYRVGGRHARRTNARIVAATHQNLDRLVGEGLFREDLFHRLNVIRLQLPPLRDRREDIPLLTRAFLDDCSRQLDIKSKHMDKSTLQCLADFPFRGNVRELHNLCHWLTAMTPGPLISQADLPEEFWQSQHTMPPEDALQTTHTREDWTSLLGLQAKEMLRSQEKGIYERLSKDFDHVLVAHGLTHCDGKRSDAARALGLGRNTISRKIKELNIE